jgi:hypothetical protein
MNSIELVGYFSGVVRDAEGNLISGEDGHPVEQEK